LGTRPGPEIPATKALQNVQCSFFATVDTRSSSIEIGNALPRQLEVRRPKNKTILDDGDVKLDFQVNAPGSMELLKLWV
jgi:hypothetical protein